MKPRPPKMLSAAVVANYVVCPEAWRLKHFRHGTRKSFEPHAEAQKLRDAWAQKQDLSTSLRRYAKIVYALMVLIVCLIFLFEKELLRSIRHSSATRKPAVESPAPERR